MSSPLPRRHDWPKRVAELGQQVRDRLVLAALVMDDRGDDWAVWRSQARRVLLDADHETLWRLAVETLLPDDPNVQPPMRHGRLVTVRDLYFMSTGDVIVLLLRQVEPLAQAEARDMLAEIGEGVPEEWHA